MEKPAVTDYDIHPLLQRRYSPRAFAGKEVEDFKINNILEAARWAPSASNDQPWRFVVAIKERDEKYDKVFASLVDFNRKWIVNVKVLIVVCAFKFSAKTGKENPYRYYDAGQAAANMTFQAMHEGLFVHQMGGFDKALLSASLTLEADIEPLAVMAVGYLGDPGDLPENFREMEMSPRTRKGMNEILL